MSTKFTQLLSALCLLAGGVSAAERHETYEWLVGDSPIIKVDTFKGSIRVETAQSGRVELELAATAMDENASRWLDKILVKANPFGAGVVLTVKQDGWGVEFGAGTAPQRRIDLVLRVPKQCTLDLKSEAGNIEVADDIQGNLRARVSTGDIYFGRVSGSVTALTRMGNLIVSHATGDLTARSYHGDLHVGTVMGWADLRADHGNIQVTNSYGGLSAHAIKGDIKAGMSRKISADASLKVSAGDIFVDVDPESAFVIDARSSWGKVDSALDFASSESKASPTRLNGARNGGGALLALKASGGDVHIKSVPTYGF